MEVGGQPWPVGHRGGRRESGTRTGGGARRAGVRTGSRREARDEGSRSPGPSRPRRMAFRVCPSTCARSGRCAIRPVGLEQQLRSETGPLNRHGIEPYRSHHRSEPRRHTAVDSDRLPRKGRRGVTGHENTEEYSLVGTSALHWLSRRTSTGTTGPRCPAIPGQVLPRAGWPGLAAGEQPLGDGTCEVGWRPGRLAGPQSAQGVR